MSIKTSDDLYQSFFHYVLSVLSTTSLHSVCELHTLHYVDELERGQEWSLSLRDSVLWDTQKDLLRALFSSSDVGAEPVFKVESVPSQAHLRTWRVHLIVSDDLIQAYQSWLDKRSLEAKARKKQEEAVSKLRSEIKILKRKAK